MHRLRSGFLRSDDERMAVLKKRVMAEECGAIMLEGMIVMVITLFVLIWILGLGFVYYQRYITTVVTNDAAAKIAATYNNVSSDIIMGYVNTEALSGRNLYRRFEADDLQAANEERASAYVKYVLDKANFSGVVDSVDVELKLVMDSTLRRHVELTTTCMYQTPFGEGLELFGMDGAMTYQVKACADCTDYADYISTVDYGYAWSSGTFTKGTGIIDSTIKLLNTLVKTYNHYT